jgi:hypothetical protein
MSIASNVLATYNLLLKWGDLPGLIKAGFADVNQGIAQINIRLDRIEAELNVPETGSFNPDPKDPDMSVFQMTVGDPPHSGVLTFSEPGAPTDGAVMSDNAAVATVALAPDMITWTITLVPPVAPADGSGVANITYTGTSSPPDVGPVVVEPLVLTVVAMPAAETGQFNP